MSLETPIALGSRAARLSDMIDIDYADRRSGSIDMFISPGQFGVYGENVDAASWQVIVCTRMSLVS